MNYYEIRFDIEGSDIWYLGDVKNEQGEYVVPANFKRAIVFDLTPDTSLTIAEYQEGIPTDYSENYRGVPLVSEAFSRVVETVDAEAIQLIPITIHRLSEKPAETSYQIMNITTKLQCVDMYRSRVERYTERHGSPEKIGQISSLTNIKILPDCAAGHHIFRLEERNIIAVVSELLKEKLEQEQLTGLQFVQVT